MNIKYPLYFVTPSAGQNTIRNIVYDRGAEVKLHEEKVSILNEVVREAMDEAFRVGLALGRSESD